MARRSAWKYFATLATAPRRMYNHIFGKTFSRYSTETLETVASMKQSAGTGAAQQRTLWDAAAKYL